MICQGKYQDPHADFFKSQNYEYDDSMEPEDCPICLNYLHEDPEHIQNNDIANNESKDNEIASKLIARIFEIE